MVIMQLMQNKILIVAIIAWILSCLLKGAIHFITKKHVAMQNLFGTGGMPSSHSATTAALATIVGIEKGFESDLFAVTLAFALIIMYDACGIRRAAGMHARRINRIEKEYLKTDEKSLLNEALGHRPIEVFIGAALGVIIAIVSNIILK